MLMPQGGEPQNPLTYNSERARCPGNRCRRNGSALRGKEKVVKKKSPLCSGSCAARFYFDRVINLRSFN